MLYWTTVRDWAGAGGEREFVYESAKPLGPGESIHDRDTGAFYAVTRTAEDPDGRYDGLLWARRSSG